VRVGKEREGEEEGATDAVACAAMDRRPA
jgi:hypothetical protein